MISLGKASAMLRISLLLACAALVPAAAMAQPELRGDIIVDAPFIRLGDLFSDAGPAANTVVSPAPAPGTPARQQFRIRSSSLMPIKG